jgi:predicted ATPase/DNA-binding CsgD family transcriptional regulator
MTSNPQLAERLTRREAEILSLLGENLSDREIAGRLVLSLHSVKWYTRQVYAKLDVNGRKAAVAKARELGLLAALGVTRKSTHNLPRALSSFIGREKEIDQVLKLVWAHRLVTLTGAGGVGKTRLAQVCAEELLDDFPDGVWYVELAALTDPGRVPLALAQGLGIQYVQGHASLDGVLAFFAERQALLVVDNCEHLVATCAELVQTLLLHLSGLKVIATSRVPLGVNGEVLFRVPSLSLPAALPAGEDLLKYEALHLFIERAEAVFPELPQIPAESVALVQICRRLDGIPLAIELAAARARVLSVEQIAARLDQVFSLLSGGSRSELPRHRTLKALIDWSYELLSAQERVLLQRLAVFAGGWTLAAAEVVGADSTNDGKRGGQVLDLLSGLVDQSLVQFEPGQPGEPRYTMLATVRQYARERLVESGGEGAACARHLEYFLALSLAAEPHLRAFGAKAWLDRLEQEMENIHTALGWALACRVEPGLLLAAALHWFWWGRGYHLDGVMWLLRLIHTENSVDPSIRGAMGKAVNALGYIVLRQSKDFSEQIVAEVQALVQKNQALLQGLGDGCQRDLAITRFLLVETAEETLLARTAFQTLLDFFWAAQCDETLSWQLPSTDPRSNRFAEEYLAISQTIGDRDGEGWAYVNLAKLEIRQGSYVRVEAFFTQALKIMQELQNIGCIATIYTEMTKYEISQGNTSQARVHTQKFYTIGLQLNSNDLIFRYLYFMSVIAWTENDLEQAADFLTRAEIFSQEYLPSQKIQLRYFACRTALSRSALNPARRVLQQLFQSYTMPIHPRFWLLIQALGILLAQQGRWQQAAQLFAAQEQFSRLVPPRSLYFSPREAEEYQQYLAAARAALDEEAFSAAWEAGQQLSIEQIVQLALEITGGGEDLGA